MILCAIKTKFILEFGLLTLELIFNFDTVCYSILLMESTIDFLNNPLHGNIAETVVLNVVTTKITNIVILGNFQTASLSIPSLHTL